jgi:glucosamine--fructose-6-phosphate aminotransferase (isomerizing)
MNRMLTEMLEQPDVVRRTVLRTAAAVRGVCAAVHTRGVRGVFFAARGSSDNAATVGRYLFEIVNGIPCGLMAPSVYTRYRASVDLRDMLVVGVSQSGETDEIVQVVAQARRSAAYTVAVTNDPRSRLARAAHAVLQTHAGTERAIPATKTYTAQLAALYSLSFALARNDRRLRELTTSVPVAMRAMLAHRFRVESIAAELRYAQSMLVLGRGVNYGTALETALKLKETCRIKAEALSVSDFLHGPIAMASQQMPVIVYAADDAVLPHLSAVVQRLRRDARCEIVLITRERRLIPYGHAVIPVPAMPSLFSPLVYVIAGQLLAYAGAVARGLSPDNPQGLRKVTRG